MAITITLGILEFNSLFFFFSFISFSLLDKANDIEGLYKTLSQVLNLQFLLVHSLIFVWEMHGVIDEENIYFHTTLIYENHSKCFSLT